VQIQRNRAVIPSKDRNLLSASWHTISSEVCAAIKHQSATLRPKHALFNARSASESAVQNATVALGGGQGEGIPIGPLHPRCVSIHSRGSISRTCTGDIPLAVRDQAALARTGDLNIEASSTAERTAGGGRGRAAGSVSRSGSSCRRCAGAFRQVLDACGGTLGFRERDGSFERASFERAADVEEVPNLVQRTA